MSFKIVPVWLCLRVEAPLWNLILSGAIKILQIDWLISVCLNKVHFYHLPPQLTTYTHQDILCDISVCPRKVHFRHCHHLPPQLSTYTHQDILCDISVCLRKVHFRHCHHLPPQLTTYTHQEFLPDFDTKMWVCMYIIKLWSLWMAQHGQIECWQ